MASRNEPKEVDEMQAESAKAIVRRAIDIMADGTREEFDEWVHPEFINHEAKDEPPGSRGRGPGAAHVTALWLRDAYADLRWDVNDMVAEGTLVVVHCTMSGRHVGPFLVYDHQGRVKEAFPPTGRRFETTQTHWMRIADGKVIEHWANRDDLGTAEQLGWVPPSPLYLMRAAIAKRRARRQAA
jgi:predicted ester cyclase